MVKITDGCMGKFLAQKLRKKHELIIMNPDDISFFRNGCDNIAEMFIYALIGFPKTIIMNDILNKIMGKRPDRIIAEAIIVFIDIRTRKRHRVTIILRHQCVLSGLPSILVYAPGNDSRPADPDAFVLLIK